MIVVAEEVQIIDKNWSTHSELADKLSKEVKNVKDYCKLDLCKSNMDFIEEHIKS